MTLHSPDSTVAANVIPSFSATESYGPVPESLLNEHEAQQNVHPILHDTSDTKNLAVMCKSENARDTVLRAPSAPNPPVIGTDLLSGPRIGFLEFLLEGGYDAYRASLFGDGGTCLAVALHDFRKATEFHNFGVNAGLLDETIATSKKALKEFTRFAYRGDPDQRGVLFWKRVAGLLWDSYEYLMSLRVRSETIRQKEITRLDRVAQKRDTWADYMRRYRAMRRAKQAESNQSATIAIVSENDASHQVAVAVDDESVQARVASE